MDNKFLLERRIAYFGYPAGEAQFESIEEYILYLEEELRLRDDLIDELSRERSSTFP